MIVALDGSMVFKEENVSPPSYPDVTVQYSGIGDYVSADAKIRKLRIRSFEF